MQPPLDEFLAYEMNDHIRAQLLQAIAETTTGQKYFTYNAFNVRLDADSSAVTVEDELDVERQTTVALDEFERLLRASGTS